MWLKLLPLIVGFVLTYFLPKVFHKRTHELAIGAPLIAQQNDADHDTLDYLLGWRDTISAVVLSLFVLLFSSDEEVTSSNVIFASIAKVGAFGLIPVMIIVAWFLTNKLELVSIKEKSGYWRVCNIIIVFCYILSLVAILSGLLIGS